MNPLRHLLPKGRRPRRILTGLFRGLRLELDLRGGEALVWAGLFEREIVGELRRLVRGCRAGIDLGAAKGELTLWLLQQPEILRVVAVEPLQRELNQLQVNLALNARQTDTRLRIHAGFAGRGPTEEWQSLDDLAHGLPAPLLIKIDIDGPEAEGA